LDARDRSCGKPKGMHEMSQAGLDAGDNIIAVIADLEKRMREAAADLEFETAARLRDEIKELERDVAG
jgi:excinuclease ABC subunit B